MLMKNWMERNNPNRVAAVVRMANELHLVAQELEPVVFPTLHFSNINERGLSVYKESSRPEEKQHRQLPVSMFFTCTNALTGRNKLQLSGARRKRRGHGISKIRVSLLDLLCRQPRMFVIKVNLEYF